MVGVKTEIWTLASPGSTARENSLQLVKIKEISGYLYYYGSSCSLSRDHFRKGSLGLETTFLL